MLNLKNTLDGYLKNVEVIGNTVQDENNLADIRSVGDKVEGQELYNISIQVDNGNGVNEVVEILSPVQLEKVGDVADRIICKDGVWGVEKNVGIFDDFLNCTLSIWSSQNTDTGVAFYIISDLHNQNVDAIVSNKFLHSDPTSNRNNFVANSYRTYILRGRVPKDGLSSENATSVKEYLHSIGAYVKYVVTNPQFIPLPHDQQVKLRTFVGQTNISFLTEIAGQIKAQVPKSLGATVNTHTEQISNLNKELDRVKRLEESTVSTVEAESNFTTVDATSNGYFEGVKLEGKTLVNLFEIKDIENTDVGGKVYTANKKIKGCFTVIFKAKSEHSTDRRVQIGVYDNMVNGIQDELYEGRLTVHVTSEYAVYMTTFSCDEELYPAIRLVGAFGYLEYAIILEGDHTQNPPEYFEGLMSVGQDVEEVIVESVGLNLLDITRLGNAGTYITASGTVSNDSDLERRATDYIKVMPNTEYTIQGIQNSGVTNSGKSLYVREYAGDKSVGVGHLLLITDDVITFRTSNTTRYIRTTVRTPDINRCIVSRGSVEASYIPHQSNKKHILYFNPTTETWEKPILREWDSVEKHSDGKYYYHKRSGEVVLNGSETVGLHSTSNKTCSFTAIISDICANANNGTVIDVVCDKFVSTSRNNNFSVDVEGISNAYLSSTDNTKNGLFIRIDKSKLATHDVAGFKQWLQANPTTVVYQLAKEEVYECTNIDLMTYSGETNYIINSGTISPKSILKVHNNISNVVKILQQKVSLLENTFIAGLRSVLAGDMYSLATILYPEDFEQNDNIENDIMVIPE